jgi:hypothetical protein
MRQQFEELVDALTAQRPPRLTVEVVLVEPPLAPTPIALASVRLKIPPDFETAPFPLSANVGGLVRSRSIASRVAVSYRHSSGAGRSVLVDCVDPPLLPRLWP